MSRIAVFPAAGGLGSSIIKHLLTLVPASQLTLVARKPDALADAADAGATTRFADYDEPSSLSGVFEGVDVLVLISYASFEIEYRVAAHKNAIQSALASGVKHIFYSSLAFGGDYTDTSVAHVMGAHLATEKYLAETLENTSTTYTVIREGLYSESFPIYTNWFDLRNPSGEITIPHDGSGPGVAWVKRDELGEATAKLVVQYTRTNTNTNSSAGFRYGNKPILLTGSRSISLQETASILGKVAGRDVKIRPISVDEYVTLPHAGRHSYHGVDLSREWTTAWEAIRRGETDVVTPDLKEILGREPEDYEATIRGLL
ncbi:hypothetical protein BJX70DRAFT_373868 [Aspergillus crustosus]